MSLVEHIAIAEGIAQEYIEPFLRGMEHAAEILGWEGKLPVRLKFTREGPHASYKWQTGTISFPVVTARRIMVSDRLYEMQATGSGAHEATHSIRANQDPMSYLADYFFLGPVRNVVDFALGLDIVTPEERRARNVEDQVLDEEFGMRLPLGRPAVEAYPLYYPARWTRRIIDRIWPERQESL